MTENELLDWFATDIQRYHKDLPVSLIRKRLKPLKNPSHSEFSFVVQFDYPGYSGCEKFGLLSEEGKLELKCLSNQIYPSLEFIPVS